MFLVIVISRGVNTRQRQLAEKLSHDLFRRSDDRHWQAVSTQKEGELFVVDATQMIVTGQENNTIQQN
jgi:hypothetical protein